MIHVGDKVQPVGVFELPLRVMKILGDKAVTVHWREWSVLRTDDLDRYASVGTAFLKDLKKLPTPD